MKDMEKLNEALDKLNNWSRQQNELYQKILAEEDEAKKKQLIVEWARAFDQTSEISEGIEDSLGDEDNA